MTCPDRHQPIGHYLTLEELCTCSRTYQRFADQIDPFPRNHLETIMALQALAESLLDPILHQVGRDRLHLTYGFCSADLRRFLQQKDPQTGQRYGRIDPTRDQHMAHERNRQGRYICDRLGAACDFQIRDLPSDQVVNWIVAQALPFDSIYFYGSDRPLHLSYGPQHKRAIWGFTAANTPCRLTVPLQNSALAKLGTEYPQTS